MEFFRPEIVLFGDSITQVSFSEGGWGARLADEYQRHADVTVRGYSGYNTKWALPLLPLVFPPESPRTPALVTVFFGANDAVRPAPIPGRTAGVSRQHVPLPEFRDNLKAIVGAIRACGDGTARVLLITPPPVDVIAWHKTERAKAEAAGFPIGPDGESSRDNAVTAQYAQAVREVGLEVGAPVIDLFSAMQEREDWVALLHDGLHPGPEGGGATYEAVRKRIGEEFPDLVPEWPGEPRSPPGLPSDAPDHVWLDDECAETFDDFMREKQKKLAQAELALARAGR